MNRSPQILVSPSALLPSGSGGEGASAVNGWRSPDRVIQRANAQIPGSTSQVPVSPANSHVSMPVAAPPATTVTGLAGQSVLVRGPIQVVEPSSARSAPSVAVRPMPVNDATVVAREPRAFQAPDQLTEITNLPRAPQTGPAYDSYVANGTVVTSAPSSVQFNAGHGQWHSATPRVSRAP
ncbi:MAG: hypothetical protein MK179_17980 [Pirellulaceae bacterium]|nr:hypothetical protein [Pirellulaceae bacterium]